MPVELPTESSKHGGFASYGYSEDDDKDEFEGEIVATATGTSEAPSGNEMHDMSGLGGLAFDGNTELQQNKNLTMQSPQGELLADLCAAKIAYAERRQSVMGNTAVCPKLLLPDTEDA